MRCQYAPRRFYKKGDLPVTEDVYSRLIAFPKFERKTCWDLIDQYVEAVRKVVENAAELKKIKGKKFEVPVEAGTR